MKNAIVVLALFTALFTGLNGFSSEKVINPSSVQNMFTEWVEYVYIGSQLYKITHHDDGSETIQAIFVNE